MSIGSIILIVLVIALLGGFSGFGGGPFYGTGYYGGGGLGLVVLVLLILVLLGKIWLQVGARKYSRLGLGDLPGSHKANDTHARSFARPRARPCTLSATTFRIELLPRDPSSVDDKQMTHDKPRLLGA